MAGIENDSNQSVDSLDKMQQGEKAGTTIDSVEARGSVGPVLTILIFWAMTIWMSVVTYRPVTPDLSENVPLDQFSTKRAEEYLKVLVGDGIPHPAGSKQNVIVRKRVEDQLRSFGYDVAGRQSSVPVPSWMDRTELDEVPIHNVWAFRRGTRRGKAIAVVTHYDSVPSGPGASDDGVGTAALLEVARVFSQREAPSRDILFLVTDGEEFGLLGAKVFAKENPLMDEVGLVINIEARGTAGPSMMFETSPHTRSLIPHFANSSPRPMASSLFYEIYKRLPNDTDFTVFNEHGKLGYNFAFIGDVRNYHTPRDNFENADRGSLQHHGQNLLGLLDSLLADESLATIIDSPRENWDVPTTLSDEAVYFDLFGKAVVWWPANYTNGLIALTFCLFIGSVFLTRHNVSVGRFSEPTWIGTIGVPTLVFCGVSGIGWLMFFLIQQDDRLAGNWPQEPFLITFGVWSACLAFVGGLAIVCHRWFNVSACWMAFGIFWLVTSLLSSIFFTGGCFLFLVPVLLASGIAMLGRVILGWDQAAFVVVGATAVGLIWLPLERLFYDAVGFGMIPVSAFRIAIVSHCLLGALSLANQRQRFGFTMICAVVAVTSLVAAIVITNV